MFFKKGKKADDIRSPSGWGAIVHKVVMFITYPFRKPLYLLLMLVLLVAAVCAVPLYYGVKPAEVHIWYLDKINSIDSAGLKKVTQQFSSLVKDIPALAQTPDKGTDQLVEVPQGVKEVRRQMFLASRSGNPQKVDVLAEEADNVVEVVALTPATNIVEETQVSVVENEVVPVKNNPAKLSFDNKPVIVKKISNSDGAVLTYLDEPKEISGTAKVYNVNEMDVDGTYVFLYGIYSSPKNTRGIKGGAFLKEALKGEIVRCDILAYTKDNVATAECFVDGISINRVLVDKGYSDRVALQ